MPRGTYATGPNSTYYRGGPLTEAAKFLACQCRRYVAEKAMIADVNEAVEAWNKAVADDNAKKTAARPGKGGNP